MNTMDQTQTQDQQTTLTEADAPVEGRQFSYHDKCSRCGVQAFYVASKARTAPAPHPDVDDKDNFELTFCKHHGDKVQPGLVAKGWTVLDFTHMLNENPSPSASEIDAE